MKRLFVMLVLVLTAFLSAQTTINRSDIPVATHFYMPIGDRYSDIQNDLRWDIRPGTNYYTQLFSGYYVGPDGITRNGWYVFTDFNKNVNYDGSPYTDNDYHPAEDWNGNGGGNTELGQPVYAIAVGRVIYVQYSSSGFGNMVQIVHHLSSGEYVLSMYAHLDQIMVSEGDLVYSTTQIGTVGNSGTQYAHLHWEIRQQSFLDLSNPDVISLKNSYPYTPNRWPGSDTQFIVDNYYDPTDFIKQNDLVGKFAESPSWHDDSYPQPSKPFMDAFNKYKRLDHPLGQPWDNGGGVYVHEWYGIWIQDFYGEDNGFVFPYSALILNNNGQVAHLLKIILTS